MGLDERVLVYVAKSREFWAKPFESTDGHQIGSRTASFTVVWADAWPQRWEHIGEATSIALLSVIGAVWARDTLASETWRRRLILAGQLRSPAWVWGRDGTTYGGGCRRSLLPQSIPTFAAKQPPTRP
ncbi:hypothetical protein V6N12_055766 [Hibiscus sabdariffa]|uniref:Uncharacterized protein n=1 Tax=Hibiscus sabdariffa TaxID=183260 RepID=A0ABR2AA39_9ROSI